MGQTYTEISDEHVEFIAQQKMFVVGTAASDGRVHVSPKGMDSFRVVDQNRVVWLNVTGSGNETAAHVQRKSRMTVMFCAYDDPPLILRLYGKARAIHRTSPEWQELFSLFEPLPGARQIFDLEIDLVQSSCGVAVPQYSYEGERESIIDWARKKGDEGIKEYWAQKNQISLDGLPTHIVEKGG